MQKKKVNLSKWQTKVWNNTARFKVINCGRRSGKSTLSAIKALYFATETQEPQIIWYLAPNYKQAKLIMWQMLKELIPEEAIKKKNEQELSIELINGSQILLKGVEDPDSLRGTRIDLAIFDEVAFMKRWDEVWKVIRPTLIDSKAEVWFISTPNGFNHFHKLYTLEEKNKDYKSFKFTSYENPYLDANELEQTKREMDEDSFAQEFLAEFRKMSGLIYKDFGRDVHMVDIPTERLDENWTYHKALDFGFAHKTALVYFAISPTGDEIYAYDGLYLEGLTIQQIADVIKEKDGGRVFSNSVADSAQPAMIEELKRSGLPFSPVEKGADSVKNGIAKVVALLKVRADTGRPTLMFNKSLEWIADEFEKYHWLENKTTGVTREAPMKHEDDAMDAIRYFAMSYRGVDTPVNPNSNWFMDIEEEW